MVPKAWLVQQTVSVAKLASLKRVHQESIAVSTRIRTEAVLSSLELAHVKQTLDLAMASLRRLVKSVHNTPNISSFWDGLNVIHTIKWAFGLVYIILHLDPAVLVSKVSFLLVRTSICCWFCIIG